jgi:hypothetical protein
VQRGRTLPRILGATPKEWRLSLPAAYQRELDRVAPRIAIFTDARYGQFPPQVDSASAPSVMIRDLNCDKRPDVVDPGYGPATSARAFSVSTR